MIADSATLPRYHAALVRSDQLGNGEPLPPQLSTYRQRAEFRLDRMRDMLTALGDPLITTPIVHVAGTSGKGSTATAIASILSSAGYRTGLHTSPYLQVATEKLQIDHELISGRAFATLVDSTIDRLEEAGFQPSYGQLWMAMVLSWFEQEMVDIAVIEVGSGGRFDLSNVVHPMVSVITEIGLDHIDTLGPTIEEIVWHKAGIIEPATPVVAAVTDRTALKVIANIAESSAADLHHILPTPGDFWRTNEATARLAVELLDFGISNDDIEDGLARDRVPGRTEIVQHDPLVILDGAHNPQKVDALTRWYTRHYPDSQPIIVAGFLETKDTEGMLHMLSEVASTLILTEPHISEKPPASTAKLIATIQHYGFTGPIHTDPDPETALSIAIELGRRTGHPVLVTGSLYLLGNIRKRWYPDEQILLQRTPWPHRP